VRTPFHIQWKNTFKAGKNVRQIASAIDILPTIASLIGIRATTKKPLDGIDLSELLMDDTVALQDRFIFNHWKGSTSVRTQQYRLDEQGRLYDMIKDLGQTIDISTKYPKIKDSLERAKSRWLANTNPMVSANDKRPFTLGHPAYSYTQIPARDGTAHGTIKRSSIHPNDTFFTHWTRSKDSITWDIEVLESGTFEVSLFYTLSNEDAGVAVQLNHGENFLLTELTEAYDPPLTGMENDRSPRIESYVKEFKPKILGTINLTKGRNPLVLKAVRIPGKRAMDVRLLLFKRIE
jgi:hypothetical protein